MLASELEGNTDNMRIIGVDVASQVLKGFCETTETQNIFLHLRKERNKC